MSVRSTIALGLSLALCPGGVTSARAATGPRFRGVDIRADYVHVHKSPFYEGPLSVSSASGFGLHFSYAPSPTFAPYFGMSFAPHDWGNQTAIYYSGGLGVRFPWTRRLMAFANGGYGYLRDPERRVGYNFIEFGAGVELFASGRLAFHPALELIFPVGSADAVHPLPGDPSPSLDADQYRLSLGLTWFMGPRVE